MATKKQKHAEAVARREAFIAKERAIGQKAIEVERRRREARTREAWETGHKKHYKFVDECPLCSEIKAEQARQKAAEEIERVAAAAKKKAEAREAAIQAIDVDSLREEAEYQEDLWRSGYYDDSPKGEQSA